METIFLSVAVVMPRTALAGLDCRCLRDDNTDCRRLFGGFDIGLYPDEADGYFLNISSRCPAGSSCGASRHAAGRTLPFPSTSPCPTTRPPALMDGGEQGTLPASPAVIEYLGKFVQEHYRPEPKKKRRKPSFKGGAAVQHMARAEGSAHGR